MNSMKSYWNCGNHRIGIIINFEQGNSYLEVEVQAMNNEDSQWHIIYKYNNFKPQRYVPIRFIDNGIYELSEEAYKEHEQMALQRAVMILDGE